MFCLQYWLGLQSSSSTQVVMSCGSTSKTRPAMPPTATHSRNVIIPVRCMISCFNRMWMCMREEKKVTSAKSWGTQQESACVFFNFINYRRVDQGISDDFISSCEGFMLFATILTNMATYFETAIPSLLQPMSIMRTVALLSLLLLTSVPHTYARSRTPGTRQPASAPNWRCPAVLACLKPNPNHYSKSTRNSRRRVQ